MPVVFDKLCNFTGGQGIDRGAVNEETRFLGGWWLEARGENSLEHLANVLRFWEGANYVVLWFSISKRNLATIEKSGTCDVGSEDWL